MYVKITPSRARVVKSVDTADLKSAAYKTCMPVRFRPRAPKLEKTPINGGFLLDIVITVGAKNKDPMVDEYTFKANIAVGADTNTLINPSLQANLANFGTHYTSG